jgi:diacylglycerol O-acyltransferase
VSIASHSLALNITVQSYRDRLDFGFIAGLSVIPQVQLLANMLPGEFALLTGAFAAPALTKRVAN